MQAVHQPLRLTKTISKGKKGQQLADGCAYAQVGEDVPYVHVHATMSWLAYSVSHLQSNALVQCKVSSMHSSGIEHCEHRNTILGPVNA
jgi:hypothetical protein